jgi:hypothetical protein
MRLVAIPTVALSLAMSAPIALGASGPSRPGSIRAGQNCTPANEERYQLRGFACVAVKGGGHRLARILAAPAVRRRSVR